MNEIIQKCLDNYAKLELHNANEAETRKKTNRYYFRGYS